MFPVSISFSLTETMRYTSSMNELIEKCSNLLARVRDVQGRL